MSGIRLEITLVRMVSENHDSYVSAAATSGRWIQSPLADD